MMDFLLFNLLDQGDRDYKDLFRPQSVPIPVDRSPHGSLVGQNAYPASMYKHLEYDVQNQ
jgi:hypothetical protein